MRKGLEQDFPARQERVYSPTRDQLGLPHSPTANNTTTGLLGQGLAACADGGLQLAAVKDASQHDNEEEEEEEQQQQQKTQEQKK